MNKLIALIAITVALYGKAQCCSDTYSGTVGCKQYIKAMNCSSGNENCTCALKRFVLDAKLLNDNDTDVFLTDIINNEEFKFDKTKVSFIYIEADLPFTLPYTFLTESRK